MTLKEIMDLFVRTLREPRAVARLLLALDWARSTRWQVLYLVAVLSIIAAHLIQIVSGDVGMTSILGIPVSMAIALGLAQLIIMVAGAYTATLFGQLLGGRGTLDGAILLLAWLQAVLLIFQLVQIVLMLAIPALAALLGLAAIAISFWLLTVFIAELHGFKSMVGVFVGILFSMFLLGLAVSLILGLLGVRISMGSV